MILKKKLHVLEKSSIVHSNTIPPNSAIYKATGLTVHGRSTGLPGIIPKISKEAAVQNALQTRTVAL